jgi:hypothetical protein
MLEYGMDGYGIDAMIEFSPNMATDIFCFLLLWGHCFKDTSSKLCPPNPHHHPTTTTTTLYSSFCFCYRAHDQRRPLLCWAPVEDDDFVKQEHPLAQT